MRDFIMEVDRLPLWVKIVLALPGIDLFWGAYRIVSALDEGDHVSLVVSAVMTCFQPLCAIFDIVMLALTGSVWRYRSVR